MILASESFWFTAIDRFGLPTAIVVFFGFVFLYLMKQFTPLFKRKYEAGIQLHEVLYKELPRIAANTERNIELAKEKLEIMKADREHFDKRIDDATSKLNECHRIFVERS